MFRLILLIAVLALPASAQAATRCWLITTTTALDISSGAVTTAEFNTTPGSTHPDATLPIPDFLKVGVDIVDASNGITVVDLTFTASEATAGTFRNVGLCSSAGATLTCGTASFEWNPATFGKAFWAKPIPWGYPFGKITVTPTGNGASDTAVLTIYGCMGS